MAPVVPLFTRRTAHTVRNAIILDGVASTPPPIVVRRTAAHLLRHAILLDFQCAFASDSGGAKPSKWRPRTAAAFATRWAKLCTWVNGLRWLARLSRADRGATGYFPVAPDQHPTA